ERRAFTFISSEVQPFCDSNLLSSVGEVIYGLVTVIYSQRIALNVFVQFPLHPAPVQLQS
ncbi:MAG: hypothetical protein KME46_34740, partial [Brasilonema angustatum HA4187-MV1]|nr:hypothetical protein [Brasilonema angustatum HA4187-MV1]